jgi:hypothetical protein
MVIVSLFRVSSRIRIGDRYIDSFLRVLMYNAALGWVKGLTPPFFDFLVA